MVARRWTTIALATVSAVLLSAPSALAAPKSEPTVTFKQGSYSVGESTSPASIAITLSAKTTADVHFRTAGGSATAGAGPSCAAGDDYIAVADALVHFANQTQLTTTVKICPDSVDESNETVKLQLFNPSSGISLTSKSEVTLTINDDDASPKLSVNDKTGAEGSTQQFTVTASAVSGLPMSVNWSTSDGSAAQPGDYATQSGSVAIPPGSTTANFNVTSDLDNVFEGPEAFNVNLTGPINASLLDPLGVYTITDDDAAPTISVGDESANESAGTLSLPVTLSNPSFQTVTVTYDLLDFSVNGAPYTANSFMGTGTCAGFADTGLNDFGEITGTDGTVTFVPLDTAESITINVCDDTVDEPDEVVGALLAGPTNASILDGVGQGTIVDNDGTPTIDIADAPDVGEGDGIATFTVTLSNPSSQTVTVEYDLLGAGDGAPWTAGYLFGDGSCTGATGTENDYGEIFGTDGVVTFLPNDTSETFNVTICDDEFDEGEELLGAELAFAVNGVVGDGTGSTKIIDDDGAPELSIADTSAGEGDGTMTFTVTLSAVSAQTVTATFDLLGIGEGYTATYYFSDGSCAGALTDGTNDFGEIVGDDAGVTFVPGDTSETFTINICDDTADEPDETVGATLTGITNATAADSEGSGTIVDDD